MEENNNMASSSLAQTKTNFLKCSICLNPFRDPRTLPCQHGFCRECLEKCVASGTNRKRKTLTCPTCQKEVKISKDGVKDLPVHFISLKDIVDTEEKACNRSEELEELVIQSGDTLKRFQEAVKTNANVKTELDIYSQLALDTLDRVERVSIDLIKEKVQDFKEKINEMKQERIKLLEQKQTNLESSMTDIQKASEETTRLIESGSLEVRSTHTALSTNLQQLCKSKPEEVNASIAYVKFIPALALPSIGELLQDGALTPGEEWEKVTEFSTGDFNQLSGININREGNMVVCSYRKGVKIFSRDGQVLHTVYSGCAMDVAVTPYHMYVINPKTDLQIKVFDSTGTWLEKNLQVLQSPNTIAVHPSGVILVAPYTTHSKISIFSDIDCSLISQFEVDSRLHHLAVTSNGEILSSMNRGEFLQLMNGESGNNARVIQPPPDVNVWQPGFVCCRQNELFVSNEGKGDPSAVYRFTAEGDYLGCVSTDVRNPSGIAMSRDGMELVVADNGDNKVKIFKRP